MLFTKQKSDILGVIASTLCLIHCIATPFIFIVQASSVTYHNVTPIWWKSLDYFFLVISFFAVYRSTQTTSNNWIKPSLWLSWAVLFIIIINEKLEWLPLGETVIYIPTFALILLHFYNKKYCQCNEGNCCVN